MYQRVNCFDVHGNSIDGYTQWDVNQTIYIDNWKYDSTPVFQFCNTKSSDALVIRGSIEEDGRAKAKVPNALLQEAYPIIVFVYLEDGESGNTIYISQIPVRKKPKPNDYEYKENIEYVSWVKLEDEARAFIKELEETTEQFKAEYEATLGTAKENADIAAASAVEALKYKNASKESENASKSSEINAKASEVAAKESEENAKISEENAMVSESNAKTSEANTKISEINAKNSEVSSKESEEAAKVSEQNTKVSEDNAKASEIASKAAEEAAKTSENKALMYETNAKTSEDNSKTSEIAAKASQDAAKISEENAMVNALLAQSYTIGGTNVREDEDVDNAKYYYNKSKDIANGIFYVTPEMFGAKGDGITDDTEALRQCIASEKPIFLNNKYRITDVLTVTHIFNIFGSGELYVANWRGLQIKNSGFINGIGLVADSADCTNLIGFSDSEDCYVENVKITSNYIFDGHESCNMLTFTNCNNVNINNVVLSDLKNIGDGTTTNSTGNMTGLYFHNCANVCINGCKADNICNVDASGNIILEDSNSIYVYGEESVFTITNSHFRNAGKRHIKTQCGKAHVSNCYFYHDTEDLVVALGFGEAGTEISEIYSVVDNCIFDIQVSKTGAYAISSSENLKCSNSYFFAKNYSVYLNGKHEYSNCHIEGVVLLASTGNEQNFHDCYLAKIVNNVSQTDIVNLYNCEVDHADGLINGYNSVFGLLRTRNINGKELAFKDCVIASESNCLFQAKGRLTNCSVRNGMQVQIQNDCFIDGFRSENPTNVISVKLMGSGKTITLKNVDLIETYFNYHTEAPTIVCYPTQTNGIPEVSHSFEGAKIFNIQDYKYYVFEDGVWLPAIEESYPISLSATFNQGDTAIYETDTLDSLKSMLVVRLKYESGRNMVTTNYTLSGTLMCGTSTITVECEGLTTTFTVDVTDITNLVPFSTDTSGNIYNTTGYKTGYRFSSSGGESAQDGAICCGFIPIVDLGDAIRITGHDGGATMTSGYNRVVLYNSSFTKVGHFDIQSARAGCEVSANANGTHEIKLVMSEYTGMTGTTDGAVYFRVCLGVCSDPSKFIVTRNKEIA